MSFDREEIKKVVGQQLASIRELMVKQGDGEYFIPDMSVLDQDNKVRLLEWIIWTLKKSHPEFSWMQTESYAERGIIVRWRRNY